MQTKSAVVAKTSLAYWLNKVKVWPGRANYAAQIAHEGHRKFFDLRTTERRAAADKARQVYADVLQLGWSEAIAKHRPQAAKQAAPPSEKVGTVGQLCEAVAELGDARPASIRAAIAAFRRIAADVVKIESSAARYAAQGKGREKWLSAVNAIELSEITPSRIEAWKLAYVAYRAEGDELKARAARISANTVLRSAKSCFTKRLLRLLPERFKLPAPLPFDGVEFFPRQSMRYKGGIDIGSVILKANEYLAANDVEAFKAFLLALYGGLRRGEIDKLRWRSIDFERRVVTVEAMPDFAPKSETSLGDVPLEAEVVAVLRGLRAREPQAVYFLASALSSKPRATWRHYRAEGTFERLTAWLRSNGIESRTPLHTLRKEAGSLICKQAGLFAASRFLRHADTQITAQHYVEHRNATVVGLGAMLAPPATNVERGNFEAPAPARAKPAKRRKAK